MCALCVLSIPQARKLPSLLFCLLAEIIALGGCVNPDERKRYYIEAYVLPVWRNEGALFAPAMLCFVI